jgi:hypothetical protein
MKWAPEEEKCIHADRPNTTVWQPWGTDLMPDEIDPDNNMFRRQRSKDVWFIGTYGDGNFGNKPQLDAFSNACRNRGMNFHIAGGMSTADARAKTENSYLAPSLQGQWQVTNCYIPCRIFKNVSYGQLGITNNPRVHELMEGMTVYDQDMALLLTKAIELIDSERGEDVVRKSMKLVRDKHTYVSRIKKLLSLF